MALEMTVNVDGIEIRNAYIKIAALNLDNENKLASGHLVIKKDLNSSPLRFVEGYTFSCIKIDDQKDVRAQVYEYLRNTDTFSSARAV